MSRTGTSLKDKTTRNRHRYGDMREVVVPVITAKATGNLEIAEGDMIFIPPASTIGAVSVTAGTAYPNSAAAVANVASVADYFLGIALDSSANGDSDDIAVATAGTFELNLKASAQGSANTVGQAAILGALGESGDGGASVDCFSCSVEAGYDVDGTYNNNARIGTVVSKGAAGSSTVWVNIHSRVINDSTV
jgi:hypothetical protein